MLRDYDAAACFAQAEAVTAPLDAKIQVLAQTWHPTGYYTADAIRMAVGSVQEALTQALALLDQTSMACREAPGCEFQAWGGLWSGLNTASIQAQSYLASADDASSSAAAALQEAIVQAPEFKGWVEDALTAASSAIAGSTIITCAMPGWATAFVSAVDAVSSAVDVVMSVLGVAADVVKAGVKAGKAVVHVAAEGLGVAGWLAKNVPLLVGGLVLFFGGRYVWRNRETLKARAMQTNVLSRFLHR